MYYSPYNPYYPHPATAAYRIYPPVDTSIFSHSVTAFQKVAVEASNLLRKLADPPFSRQLMSAAQQGNQHEVDRLIKSIGLHSAVTATYTPTGVLFTIHANASGSPCCTLTMYLRWGA